LKGFHWKDFDPNVNTIAHIEGKMFDKEIVRNKRIFAELNLDRNAILKKICLVIAEDWRLASSLNLLLLFLSRHCKRLTNQLFALGDPVAHPAFVPRFFPKQTIECSIHVNRTE